MGLDGRGPWLRACISGAMLMAVGMGCRDANDVPVAVDNSLAIPGLLDFGRVPAGHAVTKLLTLENRQGTGKVLSLACEGGCRDLRWELPERLLQRRDALHIPVTWAPSSDAPLSAILRPAGKFSSTGVAHATRVVGQVDTSARRGELLLESTLDFGERSVGERLTRTSGLGCRGGTCIVDRLHCEGRCEELTFAREESLVIADGRSVPLDVTWSPRQIADLWARLHPTGYFGLPAGGPTSLELRGRVIGSCDDHNPCTTDRWDAATVHCVHEPTQGHVTCDDANACTVDDRCVDSVCRGTLQAVTGEPPNLTFAPALWLRADSGVTSSGSKVQRWHDRSGKARAAQQIAPAWQPEWRSDAGPCNSPAIAFDGIDDHLHLGDSYVFAGPERSGLTVVAVVVADSHQYEPQLLSFGYGGEHDYTVFFGTRLVGMRTSEGMSGLTVWSEQAVGRGWRVVSTRVRFREHVDVRMGGVEIIRKPAVRVTRLDPEVLWARPSAELSAGGPVTIGGQSKGVNPERMLAGRIAEMQVFVEALSDADLIALECHLAERYHLDGMPSCSPSPR